MPTMPTTDSDHHQWWVKKESNRESSTQRGYDRKWRAARVRWLAAHPFCAECEKAGVLNNGTPNHPNHVDHIIPHRGDKRLFWDRNNWQTLCIHHHSIKTKRGE